MSKSLRAISKSKYCSSKYYRHTMRKTVWLLWTLIGAASLSDITSKTDLDSDPPVSPLTFSHGFQDNVISAIESPKEGAGLRRHNIPQEKEDGERNSARRSSRNKRTVGAGSDDIPTDIGNKENEEISFHLGLIPVANPVGDETSTVNMSLPGNDHSTVAPQDTGAVTSKAQAGPNDFSHSSSRSCRGRCGDVRMAPCFCNISCFADDDLCCPDFMEACPETTSEVQDFSDVSSEILLSLSVAYSCDHSVHAWLVSRAPESSGTEIKTLCETTTPLLNVDSIFPVTDSSTGLHFRNLYCWQAWNMTGDPLRWTVEAYTIYFSYPKNSYRLTSFLQFVMDNRALVTWSPPSPYSFPSCQDPMDREPGCVFCSTDLFDTDDYPGCSFIQRYVNSQGLNCACYFCDSRSVVSNTSVTCDHSSYEEFEYFEESKISLSTSQDNPTNVLVCYRAENTLAIYHWRTLECSILTDSCTASECGYGVFLKDGQCQNQYIQFIFRIKLCQVTSYEYPPKCKLEDSESFLVLIRQFDEKAAKSGLQMLTEEQEDATDSKSSTAKPDKADTASFDSSGKTATFRIKSQPARRNEDWDGINADENQTDSGDHCFATVKKLVTADVTRLVSSHDDTEQLVIVGTNVCAANDTGALEVMIKGWHLYSAKNLLIEMNNNMLRSWSLSLLRRAGVTGKTVQCVDIAMSHDIEAIPTQDCWPISMCFE